MKTATKTKPALRAVPAPVSRYDTAHLATPDRFAYWPDRVDAAAISRIAQEALLKRKM